MTICVNMKLNKILKIGVLISTVALSVCNADEIKITDFSVWSKANSKTKIDYLRTALSTMQEKNTKYRLVITEDEPDGMIFSGKKGRVYLSNGSGEGYISTFGACFSTQTACYHNMSTHKAVIDLYETVLKENGVEEQDINDSLDLLLPVVYNDVQTALKGLVCKDIKAEHLQVIIEHVSTPHVLCIQAKPIPTSVASSELEAYKVQDKTISQEGNKKPIIRGARIKEAVQKIEALDKEAKKEKAVIDGKKTNRGEE